MGFLAGVLAAGSVRSRMVVEDGAQQQFVERCAGIELALIFAEDRATDLPDIGDARLMRARQKWCCTAWENRNRTRSLTSDQ